MNRKIRVGIVGCGAIARAHVKGYKAEKVQFVGLADVNREAASKLAVELNSVPVYEDYRDLIVKAKHGGIGTMQSSFVAGVGVAYIDILGTKGRVRFEYGNQVLLRLTQDKDWTVKPVKASGGWAEQINHFLGAVRGKHPLSCTAKDGVRDMEIITAVYRK